MSCLLPIMFCLKSEFLDENTPGYGRAMTSHQYLFRSGIKKTRQTKCHSGFVIDNKELKERLLLLCPYPPWNECLRGQKMKKICHHLKKQSLTNNNWMASGFQETLSCGTHVWIFSIHVGMLMEWIGARSFSWLKLFEGQVWWLVDTARSWASGFLCYYSIFILK